MDYIWHLWYDATWPETTLKRFIQETKDLLSQPLPHNIFIPESNIYLEGLKALWTGWLEMVMKMSIKDVLANRYTTSKVDYNVKILIFF